MVVQTRPEVEVMQTSTDFRGPGSVAPTLAVQDAVPEAVAMPEQPLLRLVKLKVALIGTPAPTAVAQLMVPVTVLVPETDAATLQPVDEVAVGGGGGGVVAVGIGVSSGMISSGTGVEVGTGVFTTAGCVAVAGATVAEGTVVGKAAEANAVLVGGA
jgi:hypothetical protein